MPDRMIEITPHLSVFRDNIHVGVVRDGAQALLIDCGAGEIADGAREAGLRIAQALFTHHHRDQACGASRLGEAVIGVPAAERCWFDDVAAYWQSPDSRWRLYNYHPHRQMLTEPIRVDRELRDGDAVAWGPARVTAISTPGHTGGSLSYLVEVDGKRIAFSGDLIYAAGQLWELYSLQQGNETICDYHGFLGAREALTGSLRRLRALAPDVLVPSHGEIMRDPAAAIDALCDQLACCYDCYAAISALRWYFPNLFSEYLDGPGVMPFRQGTPPPAFLRHVGTSWILISETGAAFVMDCGSAEVIAALRQMQEAGEITAVEGLWITHTHDDHTDAIPQLRDAFPCEIIADDSVARVIAHPLDWRLPCNMPHAAPIDRVTGEGERWAWREFTLTAYHLPGQSYYHGGLLVEGRGLRLFFIGDSFTPAGIDDYCAQNRNFLGRGVGFDRCLALVEALQPDLLLNPHVDVAFDYTAEEIRYMRENLAERERLFTALFPWDHANYGMDDSWVRCHPYEQTAVPGATARLQVVITNHSIQPQEACCRPVLPSAWRMVDPPGAAAVIPGKQEGVVAVELPIPADAAPGRYIISIDLAYHGRTLPQFTEAVLQIGPRSQP